MKNLDQISSITGRLYQLNRTFLFLGDCYESIHKKVIQSYERTLSIKSSHHYVICTTKQKGIKRCQIARKTDPPPT